MKTVVPSEEICERYLSLLRQTLTRSIDGDCIDYRSVEEVPSWITPESEEDRRRIAQAQELLRGISSNSGEHWLDVRRCVRINRGRIAEGRQAHPHAETMVGLRRLENIERVIRDVCENSVPGDYVEVGVWRGGASIYAAACLLVYSSTPRLQFLYDTFAGFSPVENPASPDFGDVHWKQAVLRVSQEVVRSNFEKYGLLSERQIFVEGDVAKTSVKHPDRPIAVLRLDVDLYEPTWAALENLFPKVSPGGYVIVDDWNYLVNGRFLAQDAVRDYLKAQGRSVEFMPIDFMSVYFRV